MNEIKIRECNMIIYNLRGNKEKNYRLLRDQDKEKVRDISKNL